MTKDALKLALEALDAYDYGAVRIIIHEALAQPVQPEQWKQGNEFLPFHPAASQVSPDYRDGWNACYSADFRLKHTAPPQRPWVGLTDDDWAKIEDMPDTFDQGVAWAAARLKKKNT